MSERSELLFPEEKSTHLLTDKAAPNQRTTADLQLEFR